MLIEHITLRVGATTIWNAINPATGWESYTLRYWFHDGLIEWAELQTRALHRLELDEWKPSSIIPGGN
jgi:hypothetical protein